MTFVGQSAIVQRFRVSRPHKLHRITNYHWVSENDGGALGFFCEIPFVCAETPVLRAPSDRALRRGRGLEGLLEDLRDFLPH